MAKYKETSGYIIHTRAFKNSSLIVEFFSQDFGMMHLVAKGIKTNKHLKSQLQFFNLTNVQFYGKSSLKTIVSLNVLENFTLTNLVNKVSAMYLNELIHLSLLEGEPAKSLFESYKDSLQMIGETKLSTLLRYFEFQLLKHNGFELSVDNFQNRDDWLTITQDHGLVTTTKKSLKLCLVSDLANFISGNKLSKKELKSVNKLLLAAINMSLSHKKIYSRDMLQTLLSK